MTIEQNLRRRAGRANLLALGGMTLALGIAFAAFAQLPAIYQQLLQASISVARDRESSALMAWSSALSLCVLGLAGVAAVAWQLVRLARAERAWARHCLTLADALCLGGDRMEQLEKAVAVVSPRLAPEADDLVRTSEALAKLAETLK